MENIFIGNYIGTELSANNPGKLLSYYHQQYPCSNVLSMLYLKMLEDERPKDYEKNKSELLLSVYNRTKFHQYRLSLLQNPIRPLTEEKKLDPINQASAQPVQEATSSVTADTSVIAEVRKIIESKPEESADNDASGKVNYDVVVAKNFDAPTINLEDDQSTVIDSLIAKFGGNPSTIKKATLIHEPLANYSEGSLDEDEEIVSLTLAMIYADQGYPGKATKMLQKLSLIFPEKNSIFASHIESIKNGKYNQIN